MSRSASRPDLSSRRLEAFTLVEIMVVVVIIGILAAAALPTYRHITMRSKATALENDLRQFYSAFVTYNLQNARYPANGEPQVVPTEMAAALPANFTRVTPIGGVYKWNFDVPADGITCKAALIVQTEAGRPLLSDDEALLQMIDRQMDDGNLETGLMQVGSTNSLVYIIER